MPDITLPITSLAALVLGCTHLLLTIRVIRIRRRDGVVLGENEDRVLTKAIRGQANASEQMPLGLIMLALCELQGGPAALLWLLALALMAGRGIHAVYFGIHGTHWRLRVLGMLLTLIAQTGLLASLAFVLIT
ncbi:MAPEG family protein [Yoonia sp. BS5-3]|uniref:MAPEG family protein n=1 Tax=Yoonia phaeophyticola TaxID=3137369 RepID=A0ABZ2VBY4_9RHOB